MCSVLHAVHIRPECNAAPDADTAVTLGMPKTWPHYSSRGCGEHTGLENVTFLRPAGLPPLAATAHPTCCSEPPHARMPASSATAAAAAYAADGGTAAGPLPGGCCCDLAGEAARLAARAGDDGTAAAASITPGPFAGVAAPGLVGSGAQPCVSAMCSRCWGVTCRPACTADCAS